MSIIRTATLLLTLSTIFVTAQLMAEDIQKKSLALGEVAADFTLPNADGKMVSLNKQLQDGPVVISFYRGGWCPICNKQLRGLQKILPNIKQLGGKLIAISPETPSNVEVTQTKNLISFEVLSDAGNKIAAQYGILWEVPKEKQEGYSAWLKSSTGKTFKDFNGQDGYVLPIPATFVLDKNGKVVFAFIDADYKKRANTEDILAALGKLQ